MEHSKAYWVPETMMLKLNVVILPALADAVSVKTAETELPATKTVPSLFQDTFK